MGWTVVLLSASLPSLKNPKTDLFREAAMQTFRGEFRELHVDLLREKSRLRVDEDGKVVDGNDGVEIVFFLDAWDELRPENQDNLWVTNNLERSVAKFIPCFLTLRSISSMLQVPTSFRLFKGVHAVSQGIFHLSTRNNRATRV